MKHFFTSDLHLGHANIIKYDKRPFTSIEEHDSTIINNINSVLQPEDNLYILGDFSFAKPHKTEAYLQRIMGNKFFVKGNHDTREHVALFKQYGTYLHELAEITVENQRITLCHYSMNVWNKSHRGAWHLYGHSHHSLPDNPSSLSFDVGINGSGYDYKPLSFEQIAKIMRKKQFVAIDHHI